MSSRQEGAPGADDLTTAPAAGPDTALDAGAEGGMLAVVAGLGFGTYAVLSQQLLLMALLAYVGATWVGAVHGLEAAAIRGRFAALPAMWAMVVSVFVWGQLWSSRASVPWSEVESPWGRNGYTVYLVILLVTIGLIVGSKMPILTHVRAVRRVSAAIALPGAIALVATTGAALLYPTGQSYTIQLPPGWTRFPSDVYWAQIWPYGTSLTAQYGATVSPDRWKPTAYPTIGLSVVGGRPGQSGSDCHQMLWDSEMSWYAGHVPLEAGAPAANPNPDAYYVSGKDESGGSYHAFTLARTRFVGAMTENLCYLIVFTLPRGSPITTADVSAIFATFRFR